MPLHLPNELTKLPPKAPTGLIKTARYSALILGVMYGSYRLSSLNKKEKRIQAEEAEIREYLKQKKSAINNYLSTGEEYFLWKTSNEGSKDVKQFEPSK